MQKVVNLGRVPSMAGESFERTVIYKGVAASPSAPHAEEAGQNYAQTGVVTLGRLQTTPAVR